MTQSAYSADVVLREGSTVHLRTVRADDRAGLQALLDGMSAESLHFRFFSVLKSTAVEAARLAADAGPDQVVLVGEANGRICATASYYRDPAQRQRAEVGFVIDAAFHGRGLGTHLLQALANIGRAQGLQSFVAHVLCDNNRMLHLCLDSGFAVDTRLDDGVYRVALSLQPTTTYADRSAARSEAAAAASMRQFFEPKTVAVIGANRARGKIGSEVLHNLVAAGFTGRLVAVHPSASHIEDVLAYPAIGDVPGHVDLAVICVPAAIVEHVVDECLAVRVPALVIISAGFGETGSAGQAVERAILEKIRAAGARLIGPNCMGIVNTDPAVQLNATFAPTAPPRGRIAMSTQSGALGIAILDYARQLHIGFSTFVSVGNKADVSGNDLIQYWSSDPNTDVILLYLESFGNPRAFSRIARRVARRKPIVAVKSGRSPSGARAASSHTGALASSDRIVDALFHQAGVIRASTLEEMFDVATLLSNQPVPRGGRVAILTNAGGPGILAADACEARGLTLPALSDNATAALRAFLPPAASVGNPVDLLASASAAHYERALNILLQEDGTDSVLVIFIPPMVTSATDVAHAIRRATLAHPDKTVASIFMSAQGAPDELAPIPSFAFPESAAVALAHAARRGEWLRTPPGLPATFADVDDAALRLVIDTALQRGGGWLTPSECHALLSATRIPAAASEEVATEDEALDAAWRMGGAVALKAVGPDILHKTDVGGVALGLASPGDVRHAWREMTTRLGPRMTGGIVQTMADDGIEILVGATQDPTFGPLVACAMGGTLAELIGDSVFRLHPLTDDDARAMVDGLRGAPLLRGYRGAAAGDEAALRECLLRVSTLLEVCPEIQELDINPVRVMTDGVCALDARIRVAPPLPAPATRRVSY